MLIELKTDVQVRVPHEGFHLVKAGTRCNYTRSKPTADHFKHEFTLIHPKHGVLTHVEIVFGHTPPKWL